MWTKHGKRVIQEAEGGGGIRCIIMGSNPIHASLGPGWLPRRRSKAGKTPHFKSSHHEQQQRNSNNGRSESGNQQA